MQYVYTLWCGIISSCPFAACLFAADHLLTEPSLYNQTVLRCMLPASSHATQLPADQQAVLASLQERCLASADAAVQHRVLQQLRVASQHLQALASALLLQQQLTGLDPRTPEAKQQAALAAGFAPDDLEQQAHDEDVDTDRAPLTPEAERLLQAAFALADVLDGSQVSGLAFLARCSEQQLRNHFSRLRTTVRSVVQRAQKRAHGSTSSTAKAGVGAAVNPASSGVQYPPPPLTSTPGAPTPHAAPQQQAGTGAPEQLQGFALALQQQQEAALQRTHQLLDPAGLITMSSAGSFVAAMQQTASYTARRRQLAALRATGVSTLTRLCTSKFLDILQAWLQEGLAEQQLSFVRQVLHTLQHVPINTALLHSSTLLQTVRDMAKRGPVAASAAQVVRKWGQQQEQSTWDGLQPLLLGVHPGGSGAAGKAPGARQQAEGGLLGMRPLGGPSLAAQRSLSAAVKRKVQEMKAGGAAQPATAAAAAVAGGGGGGTVGTGAPRAPSSSAQQQQQQQPSSLQRQASAVGGATAGAGVPPGSSGTSSSSTAAAAAAAGFKRPSKVARTLSGAGQPSAAAQRAALVQRQLSGAAAAGASGGATPSALAAAGSTGGGAGAAAGPVRVSKPADLTPGQRLYRMQVRPVDQQLLQRMAAPGSAATASQLAQGLMSYNRSLQLWLAARCRRVGAEARSAAQLALQRQQQRQQQQAVAGYGMAAAAAPPAAAAAEAGVAVGVQGGPTEPWVEPPKAVWSTELDGQVASGQESQVGGWAHLDCTKQ